MANGRRQHNLTVLADGSVLATGGNSSGAGLVDLNNGVYAGRAVEPGHRPVEDARRDAGDPPVPLDRAAAPRRARAVVRRRHLRYLRRRSATSPRTPRSSRRPYLFKTRRLGRLAPRAGDRRGARRGAYGAPFAIATPDAGAIRKLALVRLGAVTHSVNMEQRYVPLAFTAGAGTLTATAPRDANIAPPGVYMLFAVDANGVPSVARMVTVEAATSPPTATLTQPANGATFTAPATVSLAASATDADGTVAKVEFFNGSTKLGEDTTAPYTYSWTGVPVGTYTLTARATDNLGATTHERPSDDHRSTRRTPRRPRASRRQPTARRSPGTRPSRSTRRPADPDGASQKVEFSRRRRHQARRGHHRPLLLPLEERALRQRTRCASATDYAGALPPVRALAITVRLR